MATLERFTDASQYPFLTQGLAQFGSDYYAVLGVPVDAPLNEIRRSYRNIARLLHPDRFVRDGEGKEEAERAFSFIVNPAFEVLSNEGQRRDYDRVVRSWALKSFERKELFPNNPTATPMFALKASELVTFYHQIVFEGSKDIYKDQSDLIQMSVANELSIFNLAFIFNCGRLGINYNVASIAAPRAVPSVPPTQPLSPVPPSQAQPPTKPMAQPTVPAPVEPRPMTSGATVHFERGKKLLSGGHYREAITSFKEAIKANPTNADYHANLGLAQLRQGFPGMAKPEFEKALQLDPKQPDALRELRKFTPGDVSATNKNASAGKSLPKATNAKPLEEGEKGALQKLWDSLNKPL